MQSIIKMALEWDEIAAEMCEADTLETTYKDWEILLSIPNGGILGVSVISPKGKCWWCYTEILGNDDLYSDDEWHVELAKQFINSQNGG